MKKNEKKPAILSVSLDPKLKQSLRIWQKMLDTTEAMLDEVREGTREINASMMGNLQSCLTMSTKMIPELLQWQRKAEEEAEEEKRLLHQGFIYLIEWAREFVMIAVREGRYEGQREWFNKTFGKLVHPVTGEIHKADFDTIAKQFEDPDSRYGTLHVLDRGKLSDQKKEATEKADRWKPLEI